MAICCSTARGAGGPVWGGGIGVNVGAATTPIVAVGTAAPPGWTTSKSWRAVTVEPVVLGPVRTSRYRPIGITLVSVPDTAQFVAAGPIWMSAKNGTEEPGTAGSSIRTLIMEPGRKPCALKITCWPLVTGRPAMLTEGFGHTTVDVVVETAPGTVGE